MNDEQKRSLIAAGLFLGAGLGILSLSWILYWPSMFVIVLFIFCLIMFFYEANKADL